MGDGTSQAGAATGSTSAAAATAKPPDANSQGGAQQTSTILGQAAGAGAQQGSTAAGAAAGGAQAGAAGGQQQGQQAGAQQQGAQGQQAETEISFKVPDGVQVDKGLIEGFKPLAKELGLKSEGAQKLVDLMVSRQQAALQEAHASWVKKVNEEWAGQIKADPEIGGQALPASTVAAQKAFTQFFDEATRKFLTESGYANHPGLFKGLVKIGKAISEDTRAGAAAGGGVANTEEAKLRRRYPSSFKDE